MKLTIDLEDVFCEGEYDNQESVSEAIKREVNYQITSNIRERIKNYVTQIIEESVKDKLQVWVTDRIKMIADNDTMEISGEQTTPKAFILKKIGSYFSHNNYGLDDYIKSMASVSFKSLKDRYDMQFASSIVEKLAENKLLNDEAVKMLLTKESNDVK